MRNGPHSQLGIEAFGPERLTHSWRAALGSLIPDARLALQWCRRGWPVTSVFMPQGLRRHLLRWGGVKLDHTVDGFERCWFESPNISIGSGSHIRAECWFEGKGHIDIGDNCLIGPRVMLLTSTHDGLADGSISRAQRYQSIQIGAKCWLGARAMVMPGVTVGEGSVIAAGAVVTSDCDAGGVYGGVPARRIR
jgi:maltose O-acetyltransferase